MYLLTANPLLIAAAALPAIILMVKIYKTDSIEKEPVGFLVSLLLLGVFSTGIAQVVEEIGITLLNAVFHETTVLYNIILFYGLVAFAEEGAKLALLRLRTWNSEHFNCRFDAVVYSTFVSLGFALWENIGYVVRYGFMTAVIRAVTAVPGHACFGVFMGIWYGAAKYYDNMGNTALAKKSMKKTLLAPALVHGTYDFLTTAGWYSALFVPFIIFIFRFGFRAINNLSAGDMRITNNKPPEVYDPKSPENDISNYPDFTDGFDR